MATLLKDTLQSRIPKVRIGVIGAGIIGLSSAVRIIETIPGVDITVLAENFSPNTTGDGSAGFWKPYLLGDMPPETLKKWCQDTFDFLLSICVSPEASTYGVGLLSAYFLHQRPVETTPYDDCFLSYRPITQQELSIFHGQYKYGVFVTTLYAECAKLLPFLMMRFRKKGGKIFKRRIESLSELADEFNIIINCTGVEAANIVPDPDVKPIRGQLIKVKAPWIKHAIITDDDYYILPNTDIISLGGTHQEGDWNRIPDPKDRDKIWKGCCKLVPSLKHAEIVQEWVGLRPGRSKPRVEHESQIINGRKSEIIHNYGHGGSGVTLFWGCANEVSKLVKGMISEVRFQGSKL